MFATGLPFITLLLQNVSIESGKNETRIFYRHNWRQDMALFA